MLYYKLSIPNHFVWIDRFSILTGVAHIVGLDEFIIFLDANKVLGVDNRTR